MKLSDFKSLVKLEFGDGLAHATPANVREFLDRIESDVLPERVSSRIVIDDRCGTYEEVIKDFFVRILDLPPDEAIMALWTMSFYLAFSAIESQYAEKFATLFQDSG